ncbi:MAG: amino acid adenylation domain-containing protein [Ramlibacter sp.]|nr:amino acid adenylation domain-containing protein [Ramlibacter sp.]
MGPPGAAQASPAQASPDRVSAAQELVARVRHLGIHLSVEGEELRLRAPKGSLNDELRRLISQRKSDIIELLRQGQTSPLPQLAVATGERHQPYELTEMQEAYWLGQSDAFALGGVSAHAYWEWDFEGLDLERVRAAISRLIERHDMLRTVVLETGRQQILPQAQGEAMTVANLRTADPAVCETRLAATREMMSSSGPPTDQWPLFRLHAHLLPQQQVRFHLSMSLLIVDGQSVQIFARELLALYRDPSAPLPPIGLSFRDYVTTLQAVRATAAYARAKEYWLARVNELAPSPQLPLRQPASAVKGARLRRRSVMLPQEVWERFQALAGRSGVFAGSALSAAYAAVLARWSKQPKFTLNVLDGQRLALHPDVNRLFGNFSGTSLTTVDAGGADTIEELARQLQQRRLQDRQHSLFPGVLVLREMNRLHGTASSAGVPVVFNSLLGVVSADDPDPAEHEVYASLQTPQVYLDHQVLPCGSTVRLHWDTAEEMFEPGVLDTMFEAYTELVQRLAQEPQAWNEPGHALAGRFAGTRHSQAHEPVPAGTLHGHALAGSRMRGGATAVVAADRSLSHAELRARVAAVAAELGRAGCQCNALVGVVMEKGWEQIVAVLAINAAGGAYLPIDASLPQERINHLLQRGEVQVVLTQTRIEARLDWPAAVQRIRVDQVAPADPHAQAQDGPAAPSDLAYVIFTSGSTGEPKGVMIDHRGALNTVLDINERFGVCSGDRVLAVSNLGFDLSVYDIYGLLAAGGTVVVPPAGDIRDPARLVRWLRDEHITVWNSVPAMMEMVVEHLAAAGERLPASLRLVMMSGDWIPVTLPERLRRLGEHLCIVSLGGATEASIWSIFHVIGEVPPHWTSIPYGAPLRAQGVHVLDHRLREREAAVAGELYISGAGTALGYWRDPEQTAQRFIEQPGGGRMYRTGDWGRLLPNGEIEFLGRDDLQVKVQGFRIELGEVEGVLQRHDAVRACVAAVTGSGVGGKRLVAYVVPRTSQPLDMADVRRFLVQRLPAHMVPSSIACVEGLPMSSNGKIDRKRLPALKAEATQHVPARNELEAQLVSLWEELLAHRPIGAHDHFLEIGGDSLLAVRLSALVKKRLQREFSVSSLFAAPTVAAMALGLQKNSQDVAVVAVQPLGSRPPLFLVHPVGGNILCYFALARELDQDQPVFAFPAQGLDGRRPPRASIEAMAAAYIVEMQKLQAAGPYRLGGWSLGGIVAAEMAAQLEAAGEQVEGVVMLDSMLPPQQPDHGVAALLDRFLHDLGAPADLRADIQARLEAVGGGEPAARELLASHVAPALSLPEPTQLFEVFVHNMRALARHTPRSVDAPQLLLRATGYKPELGRRSPPSHPAYLARLKIQDVAGDHFSIMTAPQVNEVAAHVARFFGRLRHPDGRGPEAALAGLAA